MDTVQQQKTDNPEDVDDEKVEEAPVETSQVLPVLVVPPHRWSHSIPVPVPPKRYFATRLLPPHHTNNSNSHRNNRFVSQRSMSKLFTTLPTTSHSPNTHQSQEGVEQIPSDSQMMMDMMEYIMYIILLETNTYKTIHEHYRHLMTMIQVFRNISSSCSTTATTTGSESNTSIQQHPPYTYALLLQPSPNHPHRFSNRMMMTAFTCDILQLCPSLQPQQEQEEEDEEEEGGGGGDVQGVRRPGNEGSNTQNTTSVIDLPPEGWMELKKRLYALKHELLSIHANDNPMEVVALMTSKTSESDQTSSSNHNMVMDEQLSNHVMMTTDFDTVVTLLSVQEILASFREQLEDIKEELDEQEARAHHPTNHRINKMVETCVSTFMKNLSELFPPTPPLRMPKELDDEDEDDDDYLIGEESERTRTMSNAATTTSSTDHHGNINIPHELLSLALIELYSPKQMTPKPSSNQPHPADKNDTNIVDRLLFDIQCMVTDNGLGSCNIGAGGRFSYANLVDKVCIYLFFTKSEYTL